MLPEIARTFTQYCVKKQAIDPKRVATYSYCFEVLLAKLILYGVIGAIAIWSGSIGISLCYLCSFMVLRRVAGGYHAQSHARCITLSVLNYILCLVLLKATPIAWQIGISISLMLWAIFAIWRFAPVDHPNKPFSHEAYGSFRKKSRIMIVLGSIAVLSAILMPDDQWAYSLALGFCSAATSVMIGKWIQGGKSHDSENDLENC